jgi:hydrogenase 3 maturation protease
MSNNPLESIKGYLKNNTAIVGIGNTLKADDGAGPSLISRLQGKTRARLFDCGEVPENYLRPIIKSGPQTILVVDASDWGGSAGEIRLIRKEEVNPLSFSTHNASIVLFLDYLQKELPLANIFIIGVQAGSRDLAQTLSPKVEAALDELADFFMRSIE